MVVDGLPRREIVGPLPPLGAGLDEVQNGIDDPFAGMLARASSPVLGLKVTFDQVPFWVFQIARVAQGRSSMLLGLGALTLLYSLFQDSFLVITSAGTTAFTLMP